MDKKCGFPADARRNLHGVSDRNPRRVREAIYAGAARDPASDCDRPAAPLNLRLRGIDDEAPPAILFSRFMWLQVLCCLLQIANLAVNPQAIVPLARSLQSGECGRAYFLCPRNRARSPLVLTVGRRTDVEGDVSELELDIPAVRRADISWKALLEREGLLQLPAAHDALTAKLIERAGFPAYQVAVSHWSAPAMGARRRSRAFRREEPRRAGRGRRLRLAGAHRWRRRLWRREERHAHGPRL